MDSFQSIDFFHWDHRILITPHAASAVQSIDQNEASFFGAQYFFHFPPLGQLINELVHAPCLFDQGAFQIFNAVTANGPRNEVGVGVKLALFEERLKVDFFVDHRL